MQNANTDWITTKELAQIKGITERAVRKAISKNKYVIRKCHKTYEILVTSLEENVREKLTPNKEKTNQNTPISYIVPDEHMLFKDATKIYFKRLKSENKLEKIMHQKTDYKNHLEEYFGDLKIREITNKIVARYKQKEFDNGYQLISVNNYIMTLKKNY